MFMKKAISIVLAMMLALGCAFMLTACGKDDSMKKPEIPEGYKEFKNEHLSFAYPQKYKEFDMGSNVTKLAKGRSLKTRIEVKKEPGASDNSHTSSYVDPSEEKQNGMPLFSKIINSDRETVTTNGLKVQKYSYEKMSFYQGDSFFQKEYYVQYTTTIRGQMYTITIWQEKVDDTIPSVVLDTLCAIK